MKQSNKITALYCRISREDDRKNESLSIENQKTNLYDFANENGFKNLEIFVDDGITGTTFDRKQWNVLVEKVKNNEIGTIIVKDLSRLGRNYLESGNFLEIVFPKHEVRFIAIGESVDSIDGYSDIIPILNWANERYSADISRKVKAAHRAKSSRGYPISTPPYGYMKDPKDPRRWAIDEEASKVVKRIYQMRLSGDSIDTISKTLRREKIYSPSIYVIKKGLRFNGKVNQRNEYLWSRGVLQYMLKNQSYVGDVINFKTYCLSHKLRERMKSKEEDIVIHRDVHEAVIDRNTWEKVQATFRTKQRKPKNVEKNMFAGFLVCSDCGANLNYKYTHANPDNHYFSCSNNRRNNGLCGKTHHVRIDNLTELLTKKISEITHFAWQFEDEFVKIVMDSRYKKIIQNQNENKKELSKLKSQEKELDIIFERLYEDNISGKVSDERYKKLSTSYEDKQFEISSKIDRLQKIVDNEFNCEMNVDGFLKIVRKYVRVNKLTLEILQEFIDKIVVHHRETFKNSSTNKTEKVQRIDIYFRMIGTIDIPDRSEQKQYISSFARNEKTA